MIARVARLSVALVALAGCTRTVANSAPAAATLRTDADTPPMLVVVVRHAEKAPQPVDDPVLSEAGTARAGALDSVLRRLPVTDVVVTHLQRTQLTAAAFVARTSATVHIVPIGAAGVPAHIQAVADTVRAIARARGRGGVLVVGHSNTVTPIVAALGGGTVAPLCDSQYAQLFLLQEQSSGIVRGERSTYGAADPADSTCAPSAPGALPRP